MGPFAGALGTQASAAVKASIIAGIGSPTTFDLGAMLQTLGMPTAAASRVELAGDTVCVRFDPSGPAIGRLLADHDWGVFIDGAAVERLAEHKIPQDLSSAITSMRMTHQWRPAGGTPHVDIDFEGAAQVPDPFSGRVSGRFACDLSVMPIPRGPAAGHLLRRRPVRLCQRGRLLRWHDDRRAGAAAGGTQSRDRADLGDPVRRSSLRRLRVAPRLRVRVGGRDAFERRDAGQRGRRPRDVRRVLRDRGRLSCRLDRQIRRP
jgi:hypothetical protein